MLNCFLAKLKLLKFVSIQWKLKLDLFITSSDRLLTGQINMLIGQQQTLKWHAKLTVHIKQISLKFSNGSSVKEAVSDMFKHKEQLSSHSEVHGNYVTVIWGCLWCVLAFALRSAGHVSRSAKHPHLHFKSLTLLCSSMLAEMYMFWHMQASVIIWNITVSVSYPRKQRTSLRKNSAVLASQTWL